MKYSMNIMVTLFALSMSTHAYAVSTPKIKEDFVFRIANYKTARQGGQRVNFYIRYAYKDNASDSDYIDYRALRSTVLAYAEPTKHLPVNVYWEVIVKRMAKKLMKRYPLKGISIELLVHPNPQGKINEPGFHGPIVTIGDVTPLAISAATS